MTAPLKTTDPVEYCLGRLCHSISVGLSLDDEMPGWNDLVRIIQQFVSILAGSSSFVMTDANRKQLTDLVHRELRRIGLGGRTPAARQLELIVVEFIEQEVELARRH